MSPRASKHQPQDQGSPAAFLGIAQVAPGDEPLEAGAGFEGWWVRHHSGRMSGNRMTSRIEGWSVSSMISRSMPIPSPAVGGMPYSSARQ